MNEIIINNRLLPKVLETGFYSAFEAFYHMKRKATFHVLILVVEGTIFVTEDNVDYQINKGELFFLKADILHYGKVEIPKATRWYYIHFDLPQSEYLIYDDRGTFCEEDKKGLLIPKKIFLGEKSDCEMMIAELVNDFHSEEKEKLWTINARFFNFFNELLRLEGKSIFKKKDELVKLSRKIQIYLEENYAKKFLVSQIEEEFCLSYKRLAAIFKKESGESMQAYHNKCKINKACHLLKTRTMNINEVGREVGFEDQLYFSRVFKAIKGESPLQWRKKIKY